MKTLSIILLSALSLAIAACGGGTMTGSAEGAPAVDQLASEAVSNGESQVKKPEAPATQEAGLPVSGAFVLWQSVVSPKLLFAF